MQILHAILMRFAENYTVSFTLKQDFPCKKGVLMDKNNPVRGEN